jgi:hypothetical protein
MQDIWLEKYRPKDLADVKGNRDIVEQFKTIVQDGVVPNMILSVKLIDSRVLPGAERLPAWSV